MGLTNFNKAMNKPHSGKSYFRPTQLTQGELIDMNKYIFGYMITQMIAKEGIKHFGQEDLPNWRTLKSMRQLTQNYQCRNNNGQH